MAYNGWTNWVTWNVSQSLCDGIIEEKQRDASRYGEKYANADELERELKDRVSESVWEEATGFALELADAMLEDVNWSEIVEAAVESFPHLIMPDLWCDECHEPFYADELTHGLCESCQEALEEE